MHHEARSVLGDASDAHDVLARALDDAVTGALLGYSATGERCTAYVMGGDLLAVHADDDDLVLLRRLVAGGHLAPDKAEDIAQDVASGGVATPALFEIVAEEVLTAALFERFREDTYRFLGGAGGVAFEPMDAIFVDNIQVGHDSREMLQELHTLRARLAPLERAAHQRVHVVDRSMAPKGSDRLLDLCGDGMSIAEVVDLSATESNRTLSLLADLLDLGAVAVDTPPPEAVGLDIPTGAPAPVIDPAGMMRLAPEITVSTENPLVGEGESEEHTEEVDRPAFHAGPGVGAAHFVGPAVEDDLDAFADHDYTRGDGEFVQSRRNLDRVELAAAPRPLAESDSDMMVVEMEEADASDAGVGRAVSLNFGGRKLAESEARKKVEVVNEILSTVVAALDEAKGGGVGQARVQVLVEGTAGAHAVLFSHVELLPGGRLPVERVLKNLKKRPEGERRHLLNRAMIDVIERVLSLADEALDQDGMEQMLEQIAGYQQRLGV